MSVSASATAGASGRGADSIYAKALGPSFERLPACLQRQHGPETHRLDGHLRVRLGRSALARFFVWLAGLPRASDRAVCRVEIAAGPNGEVWRREIGGRPFVTSQQPGPRPGEISERAGPMTICLRLRVSGKSLWQRSRLTSVFGVPLPAALGLRIVARETARGSDSFYCDVRVYAPALGCLLRYAGVLRLEPSR